MDFHSKFILPCATRFASGRVLEIGIDPGLNLPCYKPGKVEYLRGLEPSRRPTSPACAYGRTH
jgi:hypothetical protein